MDTITLSVEIPPDHHLVLDLPPDVPVGTAQITIQAQNAPNAAIISNPAREAIRAKLLAAGKLVADIRAPEGTVPLSVQERLRLGTLPPGSPSINDLINEDRGEY